MVRSREGVNGAALAREAGWPGWAEGALVLKSSGGSSVLAGETRAMGAGGWVVVKTMAWRARDRASALAGRTRLARQWRGAELLAGVAPCARVLALWRGVDGGGRAVESLAMERVAGRTLLEVARDGDGPARSDGALLAGRVARRVWDAGLFNRDHKASNLMAPARGGLLMIDTVGVRRARRGDDPAEMLAKLLIEANGAGVRVRPADRGRVLRGWFGADGEGGGAERRRLRARIERILERHGDPTPKDDPFGAPAGAAVGGSA